MEDKKPSIAAIVVTYNRCELLKHCLQAIEDQVLSPEVVYIIDNASTDNTEKIVQEFNHAIPFRYIKLPKNIGGAGGFYTGLKSAHVTGKYDAFWLMDDDGVPAKDCLLNLSNHFSECGYLAPLVISLENQDELAFPSHRYKNVDEIIKKNPSGMIDNYASPFNGILLSKEVVDIGGYPNKNMFIWGDEFEYNTRLASMDIHPVTILDAIHFHPKDRMVRHKDYLGREASVIFTDSDLRNYCKYRNTAYTIKRYKNIISLLHYIVIYIMFFIVQQKFDFKNLRLFFSGVYAGIIGNFSGHNKYLKSN